jgi:hypothetical protein
MRSIDLWRWYISISNTLMFIISSCLLFKTRRFGDWILSPYSGKIYFEWPNRKSWGEGSITAIHNRRIWTWKQRTVIRLCKIWGLHGGDYEECRLPGYKNPVRTSQETHYVSATELSQLMLLRFDVFTTVTMKNGVFGDIKTQFVPHRRHIKSLLQSPASVI